MFKFTRVIVHTVFLQLWVENGIVVKKELVSGAIPIYTVTVDTLRPGSLRQFLLRILLLPLKKVTLSTSFPMTQIISTIYLYFTSLG